VSANNLLFSDGSQQNSTAPALPVLTVTAGSNGLDGGITVFTAHFCTQLVGNGALNIAPRAYIRIGNPTTQVIETRQVVQLGFSGAQGTVEVDLPSLKIIGVGTIFTTELTNSNGQQPTGFVVGERVRVGTEIYKIAVVINDLEMVIDATTTPAASQAAGATMHKNVDTEGMVDANFLNTLVNTEYAVVRGVIDIVESGVVPKSSALPSDVTLSPLRHNNVITANIVGGIVDANISTNESSDVLANNKYIKD
jgi:hypothetical protein